MATRARRDDGKPVTVDLDGRSVFIGRPADFFERTSASLTRIDGLRRSKFAAAVSTHSGSVVFYDTSVVADHKRVTDYVMSTDIGRVWSAERMANDGEIAESLSRAPDDRTPTCPLKYARRWNAFRSEMARLGLDRYGEYVLISCCDRLPVRNEPPRLVRANRTSGNAVYRVVDLDGSDLAVLLAGTYVRGGVVVVPLHDTDRRCFAFLVGTRVRDRFNGVDAETMSRTHRHYEGYVNRTDADSMSAAAVAATNTPVNNRAPPGV
jgi:hypothetical protein